MFKVIVIWLWLWSASLSSGATNQVDLGYSIYQGVSNSTTGLTTFLGYVQALNLYHDLLLMLINILLEFGMRPRQLVHCDGMHPEVRL